MSLKRKTTSNILYKHTIYNINSFFFFDKGQLLLLRKYMKVLNYDFISIFQYS